MLGSHRLRQAWSVIVTETDGDGPLAGPAVVHFSMGRSMRRLAQRLIRIAEPTTVQLLFSNDHAERDGYIWLRQLLIRRNFKTVALCVAAMVSTAVSDVSG